MRRGAMLLGVVATLAACDSIIGVDERYAGDPDAGPTAEHGSEKPTAEVDASATSDTSHGRSDGGGSPDAATPRRPQTLGYFVEPRLSLGETEFLVVDRADERTKIILFPKADPSKSVTIYDDSASSAATRVSTAALARGKVWFTTSDGKLHSMGLDGKNPTLVDMPSSSILARSANTVWLIAPDFGSNAPTLRWVGNDLLSLTPDATIYLGGPVMFAFASDDELVVTSRTSSSRWTLSRWRPFAAQPYVTFATFDSYPSWVAADATRVLVYGQDEGTIVSWSRLTPETTPTTILVDVGDPVSIKSDGTNLVLRSQSSIKSCTIASCGATLHALDTPTTFTYARYLEIDDQWAYFFHAKTADGPMTLVRVPR